MTLEILIGCTIIALARVADVSLGTIRTMAVVSGYRGLAWIFGLFEVAIWVFAVSAVIAEIREEPAYGIAFALGAASGNYLGVVVQRWLPFGEQVVRVFTQCGTVMSDALRAQRFRATEFRATGRDGDMSMLFIQVRRDRTHRLVSAARSIDPGCYYTVDDIRIANTAITRPSLTGTSVGQPK